jgi:hypothetical protein
VKEIRKELKNYTCIVFFTFILQFTCNSVSAQEMLGTTLGNYAGLNGMQLNPSALHNSKSNLEIQLIGMDGFLQNNYLYFPDSLYRFSNFFKPGYKWPTHMENFGTEERIFYTYDNKKQKNIFSQTRINGPGAMLISGHHAFAVTTALRAVLSLPNIPYEVANFTYLGLNYRPQHDIRYTDNIPVKGSQMGWLEIGIGYSYMFHPHDDDALSLGISVKRLMGLEGVYVYNRQVDYYVDNDSTIVIMNMDAELGVSLPIDYNDNTKFLTSPIFRGGGFGFDIGATYIRLAPDKEKHYAANQHSSSPCAQTAENYLYRIGVALIDIGAIEFNSNASTIRIDNRSSYWTNVSSLNFRSINQFLNTVSYEFYGNTDAVKRQSFTMWLPAAVSAQFDYHLQQNWYLNASLIYGIPVARSAVARPAEFSVTPRYETRQFEASLPISLYNWQQPRVGLALRFYWLTVGTDKLGGFFPVGDFTGLDLYFSLKLFFNRGTCRNGKVDPYGCNDW